MSKSLHFTLGDRFGQVLTDIAQEHIHCHYNLEKGLTAIEKGLIGIPRELVIEILSGNQVIAVEGEEGVVVTKRIEGAHDALGYSKFNASKWTDKEVDKLVKSGEDLAKTMDVWIDELKHKKNGHFNIDFDSSALMQYIFDGDDSEILLEIEEEMQPYRQLQLVVDAYLAKANTVLSCLKDLYQLSLTEECKGKPEWVVDIPPRLQVVMNIKSQIRELVNITRQEEQSFVEQETSKVQAFGDGLQSAMDKHKNGSALDSYLGAQREIDKVEKEGIQASDISENLNAYWLAPNGDAYGLNGDIANMLHNQIGDMLVDAGIVDMGEENMQAVDSKLMEEGWLKLHNGEVLGDHVYHEILITQEQKDTLMKYCVVQSNYVIFMNHRVANQFISKARLEMTELSVLTDMLDIGMKKEGAKKKKSIRNIRKDDRFTSKE